MVGEEEEADLMLGQAYRVVDDERPKWPEFNPKTDMSNPVFKLGMLFSNNKVLKEAVLTYAVLSGRGSIWLQKNKAVRVRFKCAEGCPWKISAHKMQHEDT